MTFTFLPLFYIFVSIALVLAVVAVVVGMAPFIRVGAADTGAGIPDTEVPGKSVEEPESEESETPSTGTPLLPSLTVIVYSFCRREELETYMESLMAQDYPNFKVVLICDASAAATAEIAENFVARYDGRFYATFVPPESRNLSRRKLAITLGMKACDTQYVLSTVANISIPSNHWLSEMMQPVIDDPQHTEIVLGYSRLDFDELQGAGRWYRQFDDVCTSCQWLGAALNARPYRGDGHNLLLRRDLFFENKGFAKTINLQTGDDDLFVNSIARPDNTAVVLCRDAMLTVQWDSAANRMHADAKEHYDFTSRWLPKWPFLRASMFSALQWLVPACLAAAWISELPNLAAPMVVVPVLLLFWLCEILIYRRAASNLDAVRLWWSVPLFMLWHPIGNFIFRLRHQHSRIKNYTWQRRKH